MDGNLNELREIDFSSDIEMNNSDDKNAKSNNISDEIEQKDYLQTHSSVDIDRGPVNIEDDELIYDEETEMSSFVPLHQDTKKEKEIMSTFTNIPQQKFCWKIDDNPLNEFTTEFLATLAFPTLFPDSIADPTSNITI